MAERADGDEQTMVKPPTMADIARVAGVSESTVSRALAGSDLVSAKTRERVAQVARTYNYRINERARSFRLQRSSTIALVTCGMRDGDTDITASFLIDLVAQLADLCNEQGYDLLLSRDIHQDPDLLYDLVAGQRAGGAIVIGQGKQHALINQLADDRLPFVVWGARRADQRYTTVGSDNSDGGHMATHHLLSLGRRRILFLGDPDHLEAGDRFAGYGRAHEAFGLCPDPALLLRFHNAGRRANDALQERLAHGQPIDAIMATSDLLAMGAIQTLHEAGYRVPDDVAVVGFDDITAARHATPPLTTVRQNIRDGAGLLLDKLADRMAGADPASVVLPTRLIKRHSCGG